MSDRGPDSAGFSLVEVVVAMLLIGLIAVALLPALWQGIVLSADQASTATATRYLNAVVDDARADPTCAHLDGIPLRASVPDGRGAPLSTATSTVEGCASGAIATLTVRISRDADELASTTALIYIP